MGGVRELGARRAVFRRPEAACGDDRVNAPRQPFQHGQSVGAGGGLAQNVPVKYDYGVGRKHQRRGRPAGESFRAGRDAGPHVFGLGAGRAQGIGVGGLAGQGARLFRERGQHAEIKTEITQKILTARRGRGQHQGAFLNKGTGRRG